MKKITSTLAVVFLLGLNMFVKAQVCPPTMPLIAGDTGYVYSGTGTTFNSGATYNCNAAPFYIWANQTLPIITYTNGVSNVDTAIFTPCISTDYNFYWTTLRNRGTETFYEGGSNLGCVGPGGCFFPIGGTVLSPFTVNGASTWDVLLSYLTPTQSHDFVFTKPAGGPWNGPPTVTLRDCWNNATFPSVVATPVAWPSATTSFTATTAANTNIGFCSFTLNPSVAGAITDLQMGYVYVRPRLLPAGTYTMTYFFSGSQCAGTTSQFVFTINNPYVPNWTAPVNLCSTNGCVSLPPTLNGGSTAGGTWSGTGVGGTTFCPSTSGGGTFPVTYSVGISPTCQATQTHNIIVTATPTLNITGNTSICSGQSTILTGSGATNYTWMPGSVNTNTISAAPTSATTYTLTGTNGVCSAVQTVAFIVTATPTLSVAGGNICSGQSIVLTNTGTAAGSYNWSPSGGSASSATVSPGGTTTYTLSGTNGACTGTTTALVNVTPTPTMSISGAGTVCGGGSIVLTGGTATNYTWSPSGGNASTATVTPGGTTTYTLTGANAGCTSSATAVVNVTPNPTVAIASSGGTTICSGQTTTLTASGATNYTWSPNAGGGNSNPVPVTPNPTDTYTVTGETGGCTSTQVITVNVTPTPTVTALATSGTLCAGQSTSITASGATNYTWMPGGSNANPLPVTPGSTTIYTVTGDNSGCTSTQTVAVNVNPLPTIGLSAAPPSLCTGQTTVITASGANTYTWSANAGGGTVTTVTITPAATDTYTITATDVNGCVNTNTITVAVGSGATIGIAAATNTVCSGQSVVLNGSGATNYTWTPGNMTTTSVTVTPGGNTTYTLVGSNGGCSGTQTISIGVTATPTTTPTASVPSICSGQSTVLTAAGATNYTWMPGGSNASTVTVTPGSTTTYTLIGESNGCTNTNANSIVTINVTPTPTVTASASTATLCSGSSSVLTGGGATNYTWTPGNMTAGTVTVTPGANTTYTLAGANGTCTSTQTVSIGVTASPTVSATASSGGVICSGQAGGAVLTGSGATTYTWSANAGGVTASTATVNPTTTTIYTVTGTTGGCTNTAQVSVTVNATPTLAVTASSGTICAGQSTTLNAGGATNYTWMPGGSTAANTPVTPVANTTYTLTGANGGCTATQTVAVVVNPNPTLGNSSSLDSAKCGASNGGVTGITVTGGTPGYTYQWSNGSTNDSLINVAAGTYTVVVTDANGCVANGASGVFIVPGSPAVVAAITPAVSQGPAPLNVTFGNNTVGATGYTWVFGNGTGSSVQLPPAVTYSVAGIYTVTMLASNGGCWDTATAIVIIDQPTVIVIPNIFSPNGDGINDDFFIYNTGLSTLNVDIFNRWGQRMFTLNAPQSVWDGKTPNGSQASEGTYYYILSAVGTDGKTYAKQGAVTLVK